MHLATFVVVVVAVAATRLEPRRPSRDVAALTLFGDAAFALLICTVAHAHASRNYILITQ